MMINPARPMVIYESMTIDLDTVDIKTPRLEIDQNKLEINGKRGNVLMAFNLVESGNIVGRGQKRMLLSGLREYDKTAMDAAVGRFNERKQAFFSQ